MGRRRDPSAPPPKRGPGRKAKRLQDPTFKGILDSSELKINGRAGGKVLQKRDVIQESGHTVLELTEKGQCVPLQTLFIF